MAKFKKGITKEQKEEFFKKMQELSDGFKENAVEWQKLYDLIINLSEKSNKKVAENARDRF